MKLTKQILDKLLLMIRNTLPNEISCDECFEQVGRFAELALIGKPAHKAMPLVHDHLQKCRDCREEFEALLQALRAVS